MPPPRVASSSRPPSRAPSPPSATTRRASSTARAASPPRPSRSVGARSATFQRSPYRDRRVPPSPRASRSPRPRPPAPPAPPRRPASPKRKSRSRESSIGWGSMADSPRHSEPPRGFQRSGTREEVQRIASRPHGRSPPTGGQPDSGARYAAAASTATGGQPSWAAAADDRFFDAHGHSYSRHSAADASSWHGSWRADANVPPWRRDAASSWGGSHDSWRQWRQDSPQRPQPPSQQQWGTQWSSSGSWERGSEWERQWQR